MGWEEVKKINNNMKKTLDVLILEQTLAQQTTQKSIDWVLAQAHKVGAAIWETSVRDASNKAEFYSCNSILDCLENKNVFDVIFTKANELLSSVELFKQLSTNPIAMNNLCANNECLTFLLLDSNFINIAQQSELAYAKILAQFIKVDYTSVLLVNNVLDDVSMRLSMYNNSDAFYGLIVKFPQIVEIMKTHSQVEQFTQSLKTSDVVTSYSGKAFVLEASFSASYTGSVGYGTFKELPNSAWTSTNATAYPLRFASVVTSKASSSSYYTTHKLKVFKI